MNGTVTAEELSALAGVVLSLGFSYLPGVKQWFSRQEPAQKRLVMLGMLAACSLAIFGLACVEPAESAPLITCSQDGARALGRIFLVALVANQGAFEISPQINHG